MGRTFLNLSAFFLKVLLSLRYRLETKNLHALFNAQYHKRGKILFLPNHSAEVDPLILMSLLIGAFRPRPLVVSHFYSLKGVGWLMKWVRAVSIPALGTSVNTWKVRQIEKTLQKVKEGLERLDNFLVYPSGRLKHSGREVIGGNSFVHRLVQLCPDVNIVLIRITGLWGSTFSRAISGQSPDFWEVMWFGIKMLAKNGFFLMPKRVVMVEFALAPADFPKSGSRKEINSYLEEWFNQYVDEAGNVKDREPYKQVSFSRFFRHVPSMMEQQRKVGQTRTVPIPEDIQNDLFAELSRLSGYPRQEIHADSDLVKDLGLDSLDYASMQLFLDKRYGCRAIHLEHTKTARDLCEQAMEDSGRDAAVTSKRIHVCTWPQESVRSCVDYPPGVILQEVFLRNCERMKKMVACGDALSGFMTYRRLKIVVLTLAHRLEGVGGPYLGVLLPASVGAYVIILSILMAGKIPVVLNWTAGKRSLDVANDLLDIKMVLSSRRFLESVDGVELTPFEDKIVCLEEYQKTISLCDKARGMYLSTRRTSHVMRCLPLKEVKPNSPAVVLFTSGTEAYPKAVPLSHHNLMTNQRAALSVVHLEHSDALLGMLPPFHAFGFSVTGLLPLLSGLRVFFSPDPTDSHTIARECSSLGITMLCATPHFYFNLFEGAMPEQLESVRLFVTGGEKAPEELFKQVEQLRGDSMLVEGYGITECAPIVTLARPGTDRKGVGYPLPGVEVCVIDPKTLGLAPSHEVGEICVKGPNLFAGYMGRALSPFIEIEGEKWYRSGDLGSIAEDGALVYVGRIKRFIKIAGEMVSLLAIEEELTHAAEERGWIEKGGKTAQLAIACHEEKKGRPILTLMATFDVALQDANEILSCSGFGRIVKIQKVKKISHIPLTGTGKVHFRRINEMLKEGLCH